MSTNNQNIFVNNLEKYQDPEFYDFQFDSYMKDFPLLLEWATRQGGTVVDLACGTGRITVPLAEHGIDMLGVDVHEGMLARAKEKAIAKELPIHWSLQDCTTLALPSTYAFFYMTGNSFQHFLTNESQDQLLQSVHRHLKEHGVFVFNTRFPRLSDLVLQEAYSETYVDKQNRQVTEVHLETYHPLTQILHCQSTREIQQEEGILVEQDSISLRYVFPNEMKRLLNQNGFRLVELYGAWNKEPLNEASSEMIVVCQKVASL